MGSSKASYKGGSTSPRGEAKPPALKTHERGVCQFYMRGDCKYGMKCRNLHPIGGLRDRRDSDVDRAKTKDDHNKSPHMSTEEMKKKYIFSEGEHCPQLFRNGRMDGANRLDIGKYLAESLGPLRDIIGNTSNLYRAYPDAKKLMRPENALEMGAILRCLALAQELAERIEVRLKFEFKDKKGRCPTS